MFGFKGEVEKNVTYKGKVAAWLYIFDVGDKHLLIFVVLVCG